MAATARQQGNRLKILVTADIFCGSGEAQQGLQGAVLSFRYRSLGGTPNL